jgi:hypothetical protein
MFLKQFLNVLKFCPNDNKIQGDMLKSELNLIFSLYLVVPHVAQDAQ